MADEAIDSENFVLFDTTPGVPVLVNEVPEDGFTGEAHHNVTTEVYPLGTKIQVYNKTAGLKGWSTFCYGNLEAQDATNVLAVQHLCGLFATTPKAFYYSNEVATIVSESGGPCVVGLSAMTTANYGWFWCGGVVPEDYVPALGGDWSTDGTLVTLSLMIRATLATPGTLVGECGFAVATAAVGETNVGWAYVADA